MDRPDPAQAAPEPSEFVVLPGLGPADMHVEAVPGHVPQDDKVSKEQESWFGTIVKDGTARVVGLYIDIGLRVLMSICFFWITRTWLVRVLDILEKQQEEKVHLSDTVLITLLTTTTLNVLGLLMAVAFYLFPRKVEERLAAMESREGKS